MNKPKLYMLIGLPGSGKSTWYENFKNDCGYHCYASTDFFIDLTARLQRKTYDEVFKNTIKDATKSMFELVMAATKDNMDIVWDQTNLNRKSRGQKLIMIPDHYQKIAIYFPTPDDLSDRLANRPGKTIPWHVMENMVMSFEYPEYDEGFDVIYDVNTYNDRVKMYKEIAQ